MHWNNTIETIAVTLEAHSALRPWPAVERRAIAVLLYTKTALPVRWTSKTNNRPLVCRTEAKESARRARNRQLSCIAFGSAFRLFWTRFLFSLSARSSTYLILRSDSNSLRNHQAGFSSMRIQAPIQKILITHSEPVRALSVLYLDPGIFWPAERGQQSFRTVLLIESALAGIAPRASYCFGKSELSINFVPQLYTLLRWNARLPSWKALHEYLVVWLALLDGSSKSNHQAIRTSIRQS